MEDSAILDSIMVIPVGKENKMLDFVFSKICEYFSVNRITYVPQLLYIEFASTLFNNVYSAVR